MGTDADSHLREARARLVADEGLGGLAFGGACAEILDRELSRLFEAAAAPGAALVALGSYARRELCPGSDVDVLLLHGGAPAIRSLADAVWYPLWDAGLVVGHATRTLKEASAMASRDLRVLTSLLDVRHVAGEPALTEALIQRARRLAERRRGRLVERLGVAAAERQRAPIADLLEPNLKDGGGGLRDLQSLAWAGWALGDPGGLDALHERGYLRSDDPVRLAEAGERLLGLRVALHRVTDGRSDDLRLEYHDAVAAVMAEPGADTMLRGLAASSRYVAWVAADVWDRLRSAQRGPLGRFGRRDRVVAEGVVLRDDRATLVAGASADGAAAIRLAVVAAEHGVSIDRDALERLRAAAARRDRGWEPDWHAGTRDDLFRLLLQGRRAVPAVEALEQAGVLTRLVPEWEHVRALPQRNAYHRFTVDRHLLEAVAECVGLVDEDSFDGEVARGLERPELLGLGALLHDIGKGLPADHSEAGADLAVGLCRRIGLDAEGTGTVEMLVRHHLLLADVATRRDIAEEATVARVARLVADPRTLELLYLLTVGDSRATGPAAWGTGKAVLVRELFVKALNLLERGEIGVTLAEQRRRELERLVGRDAADAYLDAMSPSYPLSFGAEEMGEHLRLLDGGRTASEWSRGHRGVDVCTVVARDRPGMFATVAGVLALHGLDVQEAAAYTRADGMALEVFGVVDAFGRLADTGGREGVARAIDSALDEGAPLAEQIEERARRYAAVRRAQAPPADVEVNVDVEASDFATVVEVHADDRIGLLYRITQTFADLGLDVHLAKVSTIGDRVVDAFYVRGPAGEKITDHERIMSLRTELIGRLQDV